MLTIHLNALADSSVALRIACADTEVFRSSVNSLKFIVPPAARVYDRSAKNWVISAVAAAELESYLAMMSERFGAAVFVVTAGEERQDRGRRQYSSDDRSNEGWEDEQRRRRQERPTAPDRRDEMSVRLACATLFVADDAPLEVVRGAYRALAKIYHPDRGGDAGSMRLINRAYEVLAEHLERRISAA